MIILKEDLNVERKQELEIIFEEQYYKELKKEEISDNGF